MKNTHPNKKRSTTHSDTDALIEQNRGLVYFWASRFFRQGGMVFDDLVAAGNLGLVKAARSFSPETSVPFSIYAGRFIKHHIQREIIYYRTGRVGGIPNMENRAKVLGLTLVSLESSEPHTDTLLNTLPSPNKGPESLVIDAVAVSILFDLVQKVLTKKQAAYVQLFLEGQGFAQIADTFHTSRQAVHSTVSRALPRLVAAARTHGFLS